MRGNSFGKMFSFTSFGESHGKAMGVVIDGMPSNIEINLESLNDFLKKRAPGLLAGTTTRKEEDLPIILSGIFENKTLGTPIAVIIENTNQKSQDYDKLKNEIRPGHADQTTLYKYGIRDHRGGGRSSGRETVSRVIAGYFASLIVPEIKIKAVNYKIGEFESSEPISESIFTKNLGAYNFIDNREEEIKEYLLKLQKNGESCAGSVKVLIKNTPQGLGEPCFDKLKADLAKAMLSIGTCVGFSYGKGIAISNLLGSQINQQNNFGGIEGGISNGELIELDLYFKAPSTIGEKAKEGRHDPCILPRVLPVVEAMAYAVIADHYLRQKAYL